MTTIEVTCARCTGTRWLPLPYVSLNSRGQVVGQLRDLRVDGALGRCQTGTTSKSYVPGATIEPDPEP
jgi:hypothetical protein